MVGVSYNGHGFALWSGLVESYVVCAACRSDFRCLKKRCRPGACHTSLLGALKRLSGFSGWIFSSGGRFEILLFFVVLVFPPTLLLLL